MKDNEREIRANRLAAIGQLIEMGLAPGDVTFLSGHKIPSPEQEFMGFLNG